MKFKSRSWLPLLVLLPACTVIDETEVAVKKGWTGAVAEGTYGQGFHWAVGNTYYKFPKREVQVPQGGHAEAIKANAGDNLELTLETAFRYRVDPTKVRELFVTIGDANEVELFVYNAFRSAVRDVVGEYPAQALLSEKRDAIAPAVEALMNERLNSRGIEVTAFFVRRILPPPSIAKAIENKIAREQQVQAEKFQTEVIKEQAQQRIAEAEGIRRAQDIIAKSLSPAYLEYERLQVLKAAASGSNNVIIDANGNVSPVVGIR